MVNPIGPKPLDYSQYTAPQERLQQLREEVLTQVASKLGTTTDDLKSSLRSGQNLINLASDRGVSQDELELTIEEAVSRSNPNFSDEQIDNISGRFLRTPDQTEESSSTPVQVSAPPSNDDETALHFPTFGRNAEQPPKPGSKLNIIA